MSVGRVAGRTLTMLLIFLITIVAIVIIFAYFSGELHSVSSSTKDIAVSGLLSIKGGGGPSATLAITVTNLSKTSMVGATFACPTSQFSDSTCGGLRLDLNGVAISNQNPVTDKQVASGTSSVSSPSGGTFTAGQIYTISVTFSFADGTSLTVTEQLPAQA